MSIVSSMLMNAYVLHRDSVERAFLCSWCAPLCDRTETNVEHWICALRAIKLFQPRANQSCRQLPMSQEEVLEAVTSNLRSWMKCQMAPVRHVSTSEIDVSR